MRTVFTGGGTGGHIFPNIAVIDEYRRITNGKNRTANEILYIGAKNSVEEKIAQAHRIPFYGIHTGKFRRYFDLQNFVDVLKIPLGFFESLKILKKLKPDLVFAKGGYVSVPVVLAAQVQGIPVWLHESDVSPGLANKICSRFAQKIWLSFEESVEFFPRKNVEVVGNPLRREILKGDPEKGYTLTGFSKKYPVVLMMGGSTGAQFLNKLVVEILPKLTKEAQVVHITGSRPNSPASSFSRPRYKTFEFLHEELAHMYAIADLVVSRAGSGSIFETLAWAKPMLLIPLPRSASRGDQIENAHVFESHGFAVTREQDTLTAEGLFRDIQNLLKNETLRKSMMEHQKKANVSGGALQIAEAIRTFPQKPSR